MSADSLGDRIKLYESRETERTFMRGLPVVIRVDGRSFSKFTAGMTRPYDRDMSELMTETARYLVDKTGAEVGYTQSDEISLIIDPWRMPAAGDILSASESGADNALSDISARSYDAVSRIRGDTETFFRGRIQKITGVVSGMATARFLQGAIQLWPERCARTLPVFDCRCFEVPGRDEAVAALVWRELDATKNAVSMAARAYFPHSRLQGRKSSELQEMLWQEHGINFNDYPARFKRGVYLRRTQKEYTLSVQELARIPENRRPPHGIIMKTEITELSLPPIVRVANKAAVILDGAEPVLNTPSITVSEKQFPASVKP